MQTIIKGKNVEITDTLREYVDKKVGKLDRYLPSIAEARIELATANTKSAEHRQVAQLTIRSNGTILRVEERTADMLASIDAVTDKMVQRINRFKGKRYNRGRGQPVEAVAEEEVEEAPTIARVKRFAMTPMEEQEAIEQMELLGHDFFVFYNARVQAINVLYRRRDGNYGLIQPELA
ncbi:MAG: ribosome-associated translation inhibitor RaiA [Chloroflexi bacterium]|nr:ribosome-associated translation inhibitor RaiA [Chloroflexota bacterium]